MHNLFPSEKRVNKIIQESSVLLFAELGRMTPTIRPDHLSGLLHGKKGNHLMGGCPFCCVVDKNIVPMFLLHSWITKRLLTA